MNPNTVRLIVRYALVASAGAFAGALLATYILHQDEFEKEDEETADKIESRYVRPNTEVTTGPAVDLSKTVKVEKMDYASIAERNKPALEEVVKELLVETPKREPYLIDLQQFTEDNDFAKVELIYYAEDATLADEDDDIIVSPITVVGTALDEFGKDNPQHEGDPDVVYVRAEKDETDYEVTRVHKSYKVAVMGLPEASKAIVAPVVDRTAKNAGTTRRRERRTVKTNVAPSEGDDE